MNRFATLAGKVLSGERFAAGLPLRIGVLVERRYLAQAQPGGLMAALSNLGHDLLVIDPEEYVHDTAEDGWLRGLDLVVVRGRSWPVLCLLFWAEARGLATVNSRNSISAVHNKAEMAVRLGAGRVPMPQTWFGSLAEMARQCPAHSYPLILKPVFGDNGNGLRVVRDATELLATDWPEPVVMAQEFLAGSGCDLKLYGIGDEVWAVRKPAPIYRDAVRSPRAQDQPQLIPVTPDLRALALRCGELFGLELFGVDCAETSGGPVVIEVNDFPNYSAVPGASEKLAAYVFQRAGQVRAS